MRDPLNLADTPNQRVNVARLGLGIEVRRIRIQWPLLGRLLALINIARGINALGRLFSILADAMGDEVHDIETRDILRLEEVNRLRFLLGKNRDQQIRTRHFLLA